MSSQADKFWNKIAPGLRRHMRLGPLSDEQVRDEVKALNEEPLSEELVEDIVRSVLSGQRQREKAGPEPSYDWLEAIETEDVERDALVLNRNAGDGDPEVDRRIEELRRKALEQTGGDDQDEEPPTAGDGSSSPPSG